MFVATNQKCHYVYLYRARLFINSSKSLVAKSFSFFAASNALSNLQVLVFFCFLATHPNFLINDLKREISVAGTSNVNMFIKTLDSVIEFA